MMQTGLPFVSVPGLPSSAPSTSIKLRGIQSLRIDVFAPGKTLGAIIPVPELDWSAQAIPHYNYLLEGPEQGAVLAGGHCIPVRLPQAVRMVWHKLHSSAIRQGFPEKAQKDRMQALVLAAALMESDPQTLPEAFAAAPVAMKKQIKPFSNSLLPKIVAYPELRNLLRDCLG